MTLSHGPILFRNFIAAQFSITIMVLLLSMIGYGEGMMVNFYFGQCIGVTTFLLTSFVMVRIRKRHRIVQFLGGSAAMGAGAFFGIVIGTILAGKSPVHFIGNRMHFLWEVTVLTISVGLLYRYNLRFQRKIDRAEAQIQDDKIARLTLEKEAAEAHLRALQAQIEPHFLFNTLSNILSLMESRPASGTAMLADLTRYLRAALFKSRAETTTLGQEMEMIRAYLNIFKIRMGDRLLFTIDLPRRLSAAAFPPMLLQPVVENALRHGLEPKIEGGEIRIRAGVANQKIFVEVTDSGIGLHPSHSHGVGLCNLGERMHALFGDEGRVLLEQNHPTGVIVRIEVPHEASYRTDCG